MTELTREGVHDALTAAVPGRMPEQLVTYWTRGEGAAKIRWGTDGSFDRCVRALRRYFPNNPQGLCARLHRRATGEWPAEKGVQSSAGWAAPSPEVYDMADQVWLAAHGGDLDKLEAALGEAADELEQAEHYLNPEIVELDEEEQAALVAHGTHNQKSHGNRFPPKPGRPNIAGKTGIAGGTRLAADEKGDLDALRTSVAKKTAGPVKKAAAKKTTAAKKGVVPGLTEKGTAALRRLGEIMGPKGQTGAVPPPAKGGINENTLYNLVQKGLVKREWVGPKSYQTIQHTLTDEGRAALRDLDGTDARGARDGNALGQSAADQEARGREMLGDLEYERRQAQKRPGAKAAAPAVAETVRQQEVAESGPAPIPHYEDGNRANHAVRGLSPAAANLPDQGAVRSSYRETLRQIETLIRYGPARTGSRTQFYEPMARKLREAADFLHRYGGDPKEEAKLRGLANWYDPNFDSARRPAGALRADGGEDAMDEVTAHAGHETDEEVAAYAAPLDQEDEYARALVPTITRWRTETPIAPIGVKTGDNRKFADKSLSNRDLPLPLMFQEESAEGHKQSVVVGRILGLDYTDAGPFAYGDFLNEETFPKVAMAKELLKQQVIGPSVDLDDVTFEYRNPDGSKFDEAVAMAEIAEGGTPVKPEFVVTQGRISGATLVNIPAFANLRIVMEEVPDEEGLMAALNSDLEGCDDCMSESLAASGYVGPPLAAFAERELDGPTPIVVTDDGQVYGHLAPWGTCHVGFPNACVTPPNSPSKYAYFHTGEVVTADGTRVPVGRLVLGTKHANLALGFKAAAQHYDDTGRTVALVRAYEDGFGIQVAGMMVPDLDEEARAQFQAHPLSGDWRRVGGNLELVGAVSVPVPGFPVARVTQPDLFREPEQTALVAAGVFHNPGAQPVDEPPSVVETDLEGVVRVDGSPVEFATQEDGSVRVSFTMNTASDTFRALVSPSVDPTAAAALGANATESLRAEVDETLAELFGIMDEERREILAGMNLGG